MPPQKNISPWRMAGVRSDTGVAPLLPPATISGRVSYTPGVRSASKNRKFLVEAGKSISRAGLAAFPGTNETKEKRKMMATNYFFRNKAVYAIGIGLWMCMSCSNEELPMELSDTPVSFSAISDWPDMQQDSRADGDDNFATGDEVGVFAYYLPNGSDEDLTDNVPDFMFREVVTKQQSGNWTYSPIKYWPNNPGDKVHFVAYSPLSSTTDAISLASTNAQKGYPTINYTLTNGKTDLLASVPISATRADNPLVLNFQHILGQVNVKVKAADDFVWVDDESIKVVSVNLKEINQMGSFQFGKNDDNQWQWKTSQPQDLLITSGTTFTKSTNNGNVVVGFPVYLLPTTLAELTMVLETTINGTKIQETISCPLATSISIASNTNYVITIILNRDMTGFTATADWITTESHEIIYDGNEIDHHK